MVVWSVRGALAFVPFMLCAPALWAQDLAIADNAALRTAIQGGVAGRTLVLAPGTYDPISFERDATPDGIRSADPADPAVLLGLAASGFDGLRVENLVLDYRFSASDQIHVRPFRFNGCRNLDIIGNRLLGDVAQGRRAEDNGFPFGIALEVGGCRNVLIEDNYVERFHRGFALGNNSEITVRGNELTALRADGMNFSRTQNVLVENNHIHSFERSLTSSDHSDMIQFWTQGASEATRDVVIRGNILNSGHGLYTQSIFMRNEAVDRGGAGREMYYHNVLIENNVIINAHLHGITVGEAVGLTIRNNTLAQNLLSITDNPPPDNTVWRPTIRVSEDAVGVRVEDNLVWRVIGFDDQPGWRVARNLQIQNHARMSSAHYTQVFQGYPSGDPGALESYYYRPTGAAGPPGLGAPMLRQ